MKTPPPSPAPDCHRKAAPSLPEALRMVEERRKHRRVKYHTVVTVVANGKSGKEFRSLRSRSNDISVGGAQIVSSEPIQARTLYLKILLPELADQFVEAEVVNVRVESERRIGRDAKAQHVYGVRFKRFVSKRKMLDKLRIAADCCVAEPA